MTSRAKRLFLDWSSVLRVDVAADRAAVLHVDRAGAAFGEEGEGEARLRDELDLNLEVAERAVAARRREAPGVDDARVRVGRDGRVGADLRLVLADELIAVLEVFWTRPSIAVQTEAGVAATSIAPDRLALTPASADDTVCSRSRSTDVTSFECSATWMAPTATAASAIMSMRTATIAMPSSRPEPVR